MFLVLLSYLAFFSIALPDSMLGVAWPAMRISFQQPINAAGLVPPLGVAATLVSTTSSGCLLYRIGLGRLLAASSLLSAVALAGSATSPAMGLFLVSVVLLGLSGGAIDATLNAYAARTFGPRRINLLHASYGVGAATSPLIVSAVVQTGASWRWAYAIVAGLQLALAMVFAVTHRRWAAASGADVTYDDVAGEDTAVEDAALGNAVVDHPDKPQEAALVRALALDAGIGLAAVAVQTGIESGVALWGFTFLTKAVGISPVIAAGLASGYWVAMFVGRIVLGSLAERIGSWHVMGTAVGGMLVATALAIAVTPSTATTAVLLFGLSTAPMYPLLVLTTAERTSAAVADRLIGFQAAVSALGAAVIPPLIGVAMGVSVGAFGLAIAPLCLTAALLHIAMQMRRRR
jgi:fucose permease